MRRQRYLAAVVVALLAIGGLPPVARAAPPVAVDDAATIAEDDPPTQIDVLANDSDEDADLKTISGATDPANGTVSIASDDLTLTYEPDADFFGEDAFEYTVSAGGDTDTGTVTITVNPVNDAPSFTKGGDETLAEDAGAQSVTAWASAISKGPANEASQTLTFLVTDNTNPSLFGAAPAVSPSGTLAYTPAANANGSATITIELRDSGGTANGGQDTSPGQSFTITVTGVNDPPSFTKGADPSVAEDAGPQSVTGWASPISPGPSDESGQTVSFAVTDNTNPSLFGAAPLVSPSGTLTYTPAASANGSATIMIEASDSAGATGPAQTFTITVNPVNDAPSFTKGGDETLAEDAGAQSVTAWASAISKGPANEASQTLTFLVTDNTNPSLFGAAPAVSPSGTLAYTPAANANGSATITIELRDSGGTANGGQDTSPGQSFTITVTGVNDPPSFTKGADPSVAEDAGPQSVTGWASPISPGPSDESGQTVSFAVTDNTNPSLFGAAPLVSPSGTLTYTPAASANGSATIMIEASDSAGATGPAQTFTITVNPVNDAPSFTKGGDETQPEVGVGTLRTVVGWATAISRGPADETGQTLTFATSNTAASLFAVQPAVNPATGTLTYTQAANRSGVATVTVTLTDSGGTADGGDDDSQATFTISVEGTNNPPSAGNDAATMPEGAPATAIPVLANDTDLDIGTTLTIDRVICGAITSTSSCTTSGGVVTITGGGSGLTFDPAPLFHGVSTFRYRINDSHDATDEATVLVTVTKDSLAPVMGPPNKATYSSASAAATTVKVKIGWPATTDTGSGIVKYQLQQSTNGGVFQNVTLGSALARSVTRTLSFGSTYRFRVRATDGEDNVGPWATGRAFKPLRAARGTSG